MAMDNELLAYRLNSRLEYDRDKGALMRRPGFKGVVAGSTIGALDSNGKLQATFMGKRYMVDSLIWLLEHGSMPKGVIHHLNGDNSDNRIENLQDISRSDLADRMECVKKARALKLKRKANRAEAVLQARISKRQTPEEKREIAAQYREQNREIYRKAARKFYWKNKSNSDYRSARACRKLLNRVIAECKSDRAGGTECELGYSFDEFRFHIESQFDSWMTWANHGEWHVDHIKPVSQFIAEGIADPSVINALSNLRPLSAFDNMSNGAKCLI